MTQRNCEAHLGYSRRSFLERVRDFAAAGGAVVVDGKLRGVEPGPFVAWLRRRASATTIADRDIKPSNDLIAELGLRRAGGRP